MPTLALGRTALVAIVLAIAAGCSDVPVATDPQTDDRPTARTSSSAAPSAPAPASPSPALLPRGGRSLFPRHQLVGFVGAPGSPALGPLDDDLDDRAARLERVAKSYGAQRAPLPFMELIVVMARDVPGPDGLYRTLIDPAQIDRYLQVARRHRMLLVLDIQPGRADPLAETKRLERWLREPDVGLAIDPEWRVGPRQVPGRVFGHMRGKEVDAVARYLSGLVVRHRLPEKLLVIHQLTKHIVTEEHAIRAHPGVAIVKSVDGIGTFEDKVQTYRRLTTGMAKTVHAGFKLFYEEDTRHGALMTHQQVLALRPRPELIIYE